MTKPTNQFPRDRRQFLRSGVLATVSAVAAPVFPGSVIAADDPRPEFAATSIEQVLDFYFGTRFAADDASIEILSPLATESRELVPFQVRAPGASRMAVLFDGNPEPLIIASDLSDSRNGFLHARARLQQTGFLHCYAMRGEVLGRATRRITVSGHWQTA